MCSPGLYIENEVLSLCADYLSSVLSVKGKKVLHIDRNDHYGGYVSAMPEATVDQADKK